MRLFLFEFKVQYYLISQTLIFQSYSFRLIFMFYKNTFWPQFEVARRCSYCLLRLPNRDSKLKGIGDFDFLCLSL